MSAFTLNRDAQGRLVLTLPDGVPHVGVVPVRAFPLSAPDDGLSMVSPDGHELVWVPRVSALPAGERVLIEEELAVREFMPVVQALSEVSTFATPSTWTVQTDRGPFSFVLKTEDDIRRLPEGALIIASGHGMSFFVKDRFGLDRHSRKLLERFL